jgi:hypothetical protein
MPHAAESDHGVAGGRHWLLDEELAASSSCRAARRPLPALLRHESTQPVLARGVQPAAAPPRKSWSLAAMLAVAIAAYALLRSVDLGTAIQDLLSHDRGEGKLVVTATHFDEPSAHVEPREAAALRTVLASVDSPATAAERPPADPPRRGDRHKRER